MADEPTIVVPLELQVPLSQVQAIVRQYLLAQLTRQTNGASPPDGTQETAAPVVQAATGVP